MGLEAGKAVGRDASRTAGCRVRREMRSNLAAGFVGTSWERVVPSSPIERQLCMYGDGDGVGSLGSRQSMLKIGTPTSHRHGAEGDGIVDWRLRLRLETRD